jgi:hypothetical protein
MRGLLVLAAPALVAAMSTETFDLDIAEKRVSERDFHAALDLDARPGEGGIHVQAGAAISARAIELVLRNVRGTVHFRADLSRLQGTRPRPAPSAAPPSDQH